MAATTAELLLKTQDPGCRRACPAAVEKILSGTLVFRDSSGYATGDDNGGANPFLGVAESTVDNSGGSAGDLTVEYYTKGSFGGFVISGLTQADHNKLVYAIDNQTIQLSSTSATLVGRISEFISATECMVELQTNIDQ